jgi:cytochrome c-type biogenesis protein
VVRTWRADVFGLEFGVSQIAGCLIVLLGLHMAGLTPIRLLYRDTRVQFSIGKRSFLSTFAVGGGFALGWSPCIGPILATILTIAGSRETAGQGVILLIIYSAGLAIPFLAAGWSIEYFFRAFARIRRHFRAIQVVSGVLMMGVGVLLVTEQFDRLNSQFRFLADLVNSAERMLQ